MRFFLLSVYGGSEVTVLAKVLLETSDWLFQFIEQLCDYSKLLQINEIDKMYIIIQ